MGTVIIHMPPDAGNGLQIAVNIDTASVMDWELADVLVRAASHHQWQPISHIEGRVEVR